MDGIGVEELVQKRTTGLMRPEDAPKIEKNTRKQFPNGMPGYGADALRFTLASLASTGRDIRFDIQRMEGYRNFCNKLWNACRYVLMNTRNEDTGLNPEDPVELSVADRWIISQLQILEEKVSRHFDEYRFDLAALEIYEYTWNEYCDWYLELSKPVLQSADISPEGKRGTRRTLVRVLETLLRLAHPLIPYVTEELWQQIAPLAGATGESIMLQRYPAGNASKIDPDATSEIEWLKLFVVGIRRIRSEMNISPGKSLPVLLDGGTAVDRQRADLYRDYLGTLARIESMRWLSDGEKAPEASTALVGEMKVLIPLAGLIDKDAELKRLQKDIDRLEQDCTRLRQKLANSRFVDNAPPEVVEKERARLAESELSMQTLRKQADKIQSL
jgi:valyl-tRNA synthetase